MDKTFGRAHSDSPSREAGLALLMVLWLVLILGLSSAQVMQTGHGDLRLAQNLLGKSRSTILADGAADAVLSVLVGQALDSSSIRTDGTIYGWQHGDSKVFVRVTPESGRIDINNAPAQLLARLISASGSLGVDADRLAEAIVTYRTPHSGGAAISSDEGALMLPKAAPFQSVTELLSVTGMTAEVFSKLDPAVTVFTGQATPDIASAPPLVRAALLGGHAILAPKQGLDVSGSLPTTPRVLRPGSGAQHSSSSIFRIDAMAASEDGARFSRQIVVRLASGSILPYQMLGRRNTDWLIQQVSGASSDAD